MTTDPMDEPGERNTSRRADDVFVAGGDQDPELIARLNKLMRQGCSAFNRGRYSDAVDPFEALLSLVRELSVPRAFLAWLVRYLGESLAFSGEHGRAVGFLEEATELYRSVGETEGLARCLFMRGRCAGKLGHPLAECLEFVRRSRDLYEKLGDASGVALALCMEGAALGTNGQPEHGARLLIEARHLYQKARDKLGEAEVLCELSEVEMALGRLKSAEKCLQDALALARTAGTTNKLGAVLMNLGNFHARFADIDTAESYLTEALNLHRAFGDRELQAECLVSLSTVAWRRDDFSGSLRCLAEVQDIQTARGDRHGRAYAAGSIGSTLLSMEKYQEAIAHFNEALAILGEGDDSLIVRAGSYLGLGAATCMLGRIREGREFFAEARRLFTRLGDWTLLVHDDLTEGEYLIRAGQEEDGEALIQRGINACEPSGSLNRLPASQVISEKIAKIRKQMQERKSGH